LPKVQIATYGLPKNLGDVFARKKAAAGCSQSSRGCGYVAKWHDYVANSPHRGFVVLLCHVSVLFAVMSCRQDEENLRTKRHENPVCSPPIVVIILPLAKLYGEVAKLWFFPAFGDS
jgi:hypothetical protein